MDQIAQVPTSAESESMPGWKKKVSVFLVGQTITTFGSLLVQYALLWHLTLTTKSGVVLALAAVFGFLPQAVVSIFAGVWADRVNRKLMIIVSDSTIALATLVLAFFMLSGVDDLWLVFLVMAVRSVGAGIQMPAISALIPQIVPTDKLMRVNGINSSVQSSLLIIGPVAAAGIYSTVSLAAILFVDVVTAVIGLSLLGTIAVPTLSRAASNDKPSYFTDLKEGLSYIFSHDLVRWVMVIYSIVFLLVVAPSNLSPLMLVRTFGSDVWLLTILELSFGIGMVAGGALMAIFASKMDRLGMMVGTSILFGVLAVVMGFTTNLILFYSLFFLIGLAVPAFSTSSMTLLQETVEPERQGRVFGFVGIVMAVAMPLGMAVLGPLADIVSVEMLLIATGAITVLIAVVAVLLPAGKRAIAAAHASTGPEAK
ncbi:ProP Permeases of the major facilitator superfamily [Microbacteriaceae bacterium]